MPEFVFLPRTRVATYADSHRLVSLRMVWLVTAIVLALYLIAIGWLMGWGGDFFIADALYRWQGGQWALREHWLTSGLLHTGGKRFTVLLWVATAGMALLAFWRERWRYLRRPLLVLLASVLLSTVLVALLKKAVPMDCPWHLLRYGGQLPFVGLWQARPSGLPVNACFPAAHAATAFAWVALFLFFRRVSPRWRWAGLAAALAVGFAFGFAQQLRGAHFLSHDLTSLLLCWCIALAVDAVFGKPVLSAEKE